MRTEAKKFSKGKRMAKQNPEQQIFKKRHSDIPKVKRRRLVGQKNLYFVVLCQSGGNFTHNPRISSGMHGAEQ